jgi:hypothetical protein
VSFFSLCSLLLGHLQGGEAVGIGAPPGDLPLELLETHGLGLAVTLVALGIGCS